MNTPGTEMTSQPGVMKPAPDRMMGNKSQEQLFYENLDQD